MPAAVPPASPRALTAIGLGTVAWLALLVAALAHVMGGLAFSRLDISVSSIQRPLSVAALSLVAACVLRGPRRLVIDLAASTLPAAATSLFILGLLAATIAERGATSVGGADSAGYLAQAARWQDGAVRVPLPLDIPGLQDPAWRQSGLGFRPDPSGQATVPSYPPGLPWLQAVARTIGGDSAAIRVLPWVAALAALLAAGALARPGGPWAVTLALSWLASSPPFLFQALQPMSDVPALALWLSALACAGRRSRPAVAATAVSTMAAILVRPNLAPLVLAVAWRASTSNPERRAPRAAVVLGAAALAVAVVAGVQAWLYGHPLISGYGAASDLFALGHVPLNLRLYVAWIGAALPIPAIALLIAGIAAVVTGIGNRTPDWHASAALMAMLTVALYLVYVPFDSWTYLRFLLVPLALVAVAGAVTLQRWIDRAPVAARLLLSATCVLIVGLSSVQRARVLGVFDVRDQEARYVAAGRLAEDLGAPAGVVIAAQHATSAPYYSGLPVLRADLLDPPAWQAIEAWSQSTGRPLVFVLDTDEAESFRTRVASEGGAALDWPPRADVGRPARTRVWLSTDRARFLAGDLIPTRRVTP